jgi:hypothetical protein
MKHASLRCRAAITLALTSIILMSAACDANSVNLFGGNTQQMEGPTATASHTPMPTNTPIPYGIQAIDLLESVPSLSTTRERLQSLRVTRVGDGAVLTGIDMLRWMLIDQGYDPEWTYNMKVGLLGVISDYYEFPSQGQRIFLINVAHGLMVEVKGQVPWSLQNYSPEDINNLFIEDDALRYAYPSLDRGTLPTGMPNLISHAHPMGGDIVEQAHLLQYHLAHGLIDGSSSHFDAAAALTVWMQQSFFHANEDYPWDVYLDGREPLDTGGPVAYPTSLMRVYEERVIGCHEPAIMLEGMLHSLNIPALRLNVHGHGVVYLPTLDRYVHGDHIANYTAAPPGTLLLTPDEFRPYAEDVAWIFQIFFDKYQPPFPSIPLKRDGGDLYIYARGLVNRPEMTCIEISDEDWTWLSSQLASYNIFYDNVNCELTSDRVPIQVLQELSNEAE